MLLQECGNPENGYAKYRCLDCGKVYVDKYHQWSKVGYFSYKFLRKSWQKVLLYFLKKDFLIIKKS